MGILEFLFAILYIVIFPIGQLVVFNFVKSVNLSLLDLFTFLVLTYWIFFGKKKIKSSLFSPLLIFIGVLFLSFIVNLYWIPFNMLSSSFLYIIRWLLYLSVFFVLINSSKNVKTVVPYFMIGGGLLVVAIGYFQYFFYPSLQNLYEYGWDKHLYRLFSSFLDPNFCGIILSLIFILNFQIVKKLKKIEYKILFIFIQLLTFLAVLLTYSRTGVITLVFSTVALLILSRKRRLALGFVILLLAAVYLVPTISGYLNVRTFKIEGTNFLRMTSVSARIKALEEGFWLFSKKPIFGVGFNNLRYAQYKEGIIGGPNWQNTHAGGGTDNSILFIAETTGMVGLGAYLFLLVSIFKELFKKRKNSLAIITISSLLGVLVGSFFINALFYPFIMLWLWSLIGVTLST